MSASRLPRGWCKALVLLLAVSTHSVVAEDERSGSCKDVSMSTDPEISAETLVHRPVLFVLGAQKAGTTYMFNLLKRHPNIYPLSFIPKPGQPYPHNFDFAVKEPHVFDSAHGLPASKLAQYASETRPGWVLDATPDYLDTPVAACRIRRYFTNARFVVIVRDPIARAISAWTMVQLNQIFHNQTTHKWLGLPRLMDEVQREINHLTNTMNCSVSTGKPGHTNWADCMHDHIPFHGCLDKYSGHAQNCMFGFVWKGLYARQLEFWLSLFSPSQFHVVSFYDLKHNPEKIVDSVYNFLNLTHMAGTPKPHLHLDMKLHQAMHSYVDQPKRSKWCEHAGLRRVITTLLLFFARPQHDLEELLKKHGWTDALSAARQIEYVCQIQEFADVMM